MGICRTVATSRQTALSAAQQEEEAVLQDALKKRREEFGPPAHLDAAPASQPFSFRQASPPAPSSTANEPRADGFQPGSISQGSPAEGAATKKPLNWQGLPQPSSTAPQQPGNASSSVGQPQSQSAPAGFVQFGAKPGQSADQ